MPFSRWQATIVRANGDVVPNAQIDVYREQGGARQALKADYEGVSAKSNPFAADSSGFAFFHAPAGRYRIVATAGEFSHEWRQVPLGTAQAYDIDTLSGDLYSTTYFDVQVDELTDRDAYDAEDAGFVVLVSDTGDGRAAIYSRTETPGEWSAPAFLTSAYLRIVTPEMFGAVGNGVADDTGALEDAIASGNSVYLPNGSVYYISRVILMASNTHIYGEGTILAAPGDIFTSPGTPWPSPHMAVLGAIDISGTPTLTNIRVEGITVDTSAWQDGLPSAAARCVHIFHADNARVDNCRFITTGGGVGFTGCRNIAASGNVIECVDPGTPNTGGGGYADGMIDVWGNWGIDLNGAIIRGNRIEGNGFARWGIMFTADTYESNEMDIYNAVISDNVIKGIHFDGMWIFGRDAALDGVTVSGNVIDTARNGISVSDARNVNVTGNTIKNTRFSAILTFSEDQAYQAIGVYDSTFANNLCDNCGNEPDPAQSPVLYFSEKTVDCIISGNNITGTAHYYGAVFATGCNTNLYVNNRVAQGRGSRLLNQGTGNLIDGANYMPTFTNVSNVASSSLLSAQYFAGNNQFVQVNIRVLITPTAAAATQLGISLPSASDIIDGIVIGLAAAGTATIAGTVNHDATNDRAILVFTSPDTSARTWNIMFSYALRYAVP